MPEDRTFVVDFSFNVDAATPWEAALKAREFMNEPHPQPYLEVSSAMDKPEVFDFEEIDESMAEYLRVFVQHYCVAMLWANAYTYRRNDDDEVVNYRGKVVDPEHAGSEDDITVSFGDAGIQPGDWINGNDAQWALSAFSDDSRQLIEEDCESFVRDSWPDLQAARDQYGRGADSCGHDFALTRNHHGAGFWDRGMGDVGRRLTDASHSYGDSNAWWSGEDGAPVTLE